MKILLLTHTFNCLCQRVFLELTRLGHTVSIEFDIDNSVLNEALELFKPQLLIAPFLKRAIPPEVYNSIPCIVIHPGIVGDKGPSSLDWAIANEEPTWGVTALQASAVMDGGDVWAYAEFPMRKASKSSLYRNEVSNAAVRVVSQVVRYAEQSDFRPTPLANFGETRGQMRSLMKQAERQFSWQTATVDEILRKVRAADGSPGVLAKIAGKECYVFGAYPELNLHGEPGVVIAKRNGAICVACFDGAVWITHLQERRPDLTQNREAPGRGIKLAAERVLGESVGHVPEVPAPLHKQAGTWQDIFVEEHASVAYLYFDFYNGAMGITHSNRLRDAFVRCKSLGVRAIVLMGGHDFWSNGIHLNEIESAPSAADASMENIKAINRVAREVLESTDVVTVSALRGNVGSGGCFLALASDFVWCREGVVLNPHYKNMGNLFGSEYWTYVLPKRMGLAGKKLMARRLPIDAAQARDIGFLDDVFGSDQTEFCEILKARVEAFVQSENFGSFVANKKAKRAAHEAEKPLHEYEQEELAQMHRNFYGFDPSYHVARYNFVFKIPHSRTPLHLAQHRVR